MQAPLAGEWLKLLRQLVAIDIDEMSANDGRTSQPALQSIAVNHRDERVIEFHANHALASLSPNALRRMSRFGLHGFMYTTSHNHCQQRSTTY